jgi:hypothetical protein
MEFFRPRLFSLELSVDIVKNQLTAACCQLCEPKECDDIKLETRGDKQKSKIESAGLCAPGDYAGVAE